VEGEEFFLWVFIKIDVFYGPSSLSAQQLCTLDRWDPFIRCPQPHGFLKEMVWVSKKVSGVYSVLSLFLGNLWGDDKALRINRVIGSRTWSQHCIKPINFKSY